MATKNKQLQDEQEFKEGFDAPDAPPSDQTEDQAFGIEPDAAADSGSPDDSPGDGTPAAETIDPAADASGNSPATGDGNVADAADVLTDQVQDDQADTGNDAQAENQPMSEQQLRSWEGRLRKQQQEIDAKGASSDNAETDPSETDGMGDEDPQAIEAAGDQISPDDAMAKLSEDFGPEFVAMIVSIATKKAEDAAAKVAGDSVAGVSSNVDGIIAHLKDRNARDHFNAINSAHPDFLEVNASPEFAAFLTTRPDMGDDKRILDSGNASEINGLLTAFKNANNQAGANEPGDGDQKNRDQESDENAADAAEGVRSGGIQLPETPVSSQDYEEAWNQA